MFNSGGGPFAGFGQTNNGNNSNGNNGQTPQSSFGNFGGNMNNTAPIFGQSPQGTSGSSSFGGFGNSAANQQTTTPGFGSFGQPAQQSGTFGFGSSNNTSTPSFGTGGTGLFGTPSSTNAVTTFGAQQPSSGLFGSSATSNTFGNSVFVPSSVTSTANTNGTSNPAFAVQVEKEGAGGTGTNQFQSITCMPAYAGSSFEELRMQDYNQNRRYGTSSSSFNTGSFGTSVAPNAFGSQAQSSPFGMQNTTNISSPFGQSSTVSQPGVFGSTQNATTSAFGAPASGIFGANNASANNATFGTNPSTGFGTSSSGTPSTPFGQTTAAPFGAVQNSNSPFGNNNNNNSNPFGQGAATTTPKPFSFGSNAQGSNLFGSTSGTTNTNTSSFGAINSTSANNPPTTNFFGQPATAPGGSGLFGQSNTGQSTNSGFTFGASNAPAANNAASSAFNFGGTNTATGNSTSNTTPKPFSFGTPASGTSGTFGAGQSNAAAKPFSFGSSTVNSQPSSTNNLFGQNSTSSAPSGNTMFGNNNTSSSLFNTDNGTSNQAFNSTSNLFSKPSGASLFGGSNSSQPVQSLFGAPQNQTGSTIGNSSLSNFGIAQAPTNGFGQAPSSYGQISQQTVNNNPYGANPLFSSIQGQHNPSAARGPVATPLVSTSPKKKPAALPHFKLQPRSPASSPRIQSFKKANLYGQSHEDSSRKSFSLFDEDLLLQPDAFSPRTNIKRLVIDRKSGHENFLSGELDLESSQTGPPKVGEATRPPRTTRLSDKETTPDVSSHDQNNEANIERTEKADTKPSSPKARSEVDGVHTPIAHKSGDLKANRELIDQYWTSPAMATLLDYSKAQLSKVKDFKVGRRGYGQISFMSPVDLSTFETIEDVPGKIVLFEGKMCTIYPEENLKPAAGKGLNVAATITLEHCYPLSKDKREPIRDPEHPRFQQHVDRLQRMLGTSFVDYLADTGTWIFRVDHF